MPSQRQSMAKGANGLWTVTLGQPQLQRYVFFVDGVRVADETNSDIDIGRSSMFSLVDIPAAPPRIDEQQQVPHGTIEIRQYRLARSES